MTISCTSCEREFEAVAGIPDLRVAGDSWIDFEDDLSIARELAAMECSLPELVRSVYARREGWDEGRIDRRTREVLQAPERLKSDVEGWLKAFCVEDGLPLDLGCGAGMLLAAMAMEGKNALGIDVSMTWLVVAKRLIEEHGGEPILAAAMAEHLPLNDGSVSGVVSLDVIEHVRDPDRYLAEINRAVRPGGNFAISTPNRFSLTAEPHVFVWGVGWLPQPWQKGYGKWRSGKTYDDTVLMSSAKLSGKVSRNTDFDYRIIIPEVPPEHIQSFAGPKALVARIYNQLAASSFFRLPFLAIAPFFRIVGTKVHKKPKVTDLRRGSRHPFGIAVSLLGG